MLKAFNSYFILLPLILGAFPLHSVRSSENMEYNTEINAFSSKIESLNLEKKINRSLFLPELSINGGVGSEKLLDKANETDKGPYLFLDGKLNLYRGGKDSYLQNKTQTQIEIAKIEKELKTRNLNIESFKIATELDSISKINQLIDEEVKTNQTEKLMAKKKVDAGLTTSVDLLDFELKNENLSNEKEKNILKKEELEKNLANLYGGNISLENILRNYYELLQKELVTFSTKTENLPHLVLAKKQINVTELDKKSAKSDYLPIIYIEGKWGRITPQEKFSDQNREHQIALNISFPIFTGFSTDAKYGQAVIETNQKERELKQTEIELNTKKNIELKKIVLFKKILTSLEQSLKQAERYKELTIGEYKRGIKNSPDIISASDKKFEYKRKIIENTNELLIATYSYNETFKSYKEE